MLLLLVRLGWKWLWRGEPCPFGSLERMFQEYAVQGVTKHTCSQCSGSPGQAGWVTRGQSVQGHFACCPRRASSSPELAFPLPGRSVFNRHTMNTPLLSLLQQCSFWHCLRVSCISDCQKLVLFCEVPGGWMFLVAFKAASLEGWLNDGERESRHLYFVSKQVCCLKFYCSTGPSFLKRYFPRSGALKFHQSDCFGLFFFLNLKGSLIFNKINILNQIL